MINVRHKQSKGRIINIAGEEGTTSSVIHECPHGMHKFANSGGKHETCFMYRSKAAEGHSLPIMIIYMVINCFIMSYYIYNVFQISQVYQKLLNSPWIPADQNTLHILGRLIASYATLVVQQRKAHQNFL